MNLREAHDNDKEISTKSIFKTSDVQTISLKIKAGGHLKEHITATPALLVCVEGEVVYEDEHQLEITLKSGDYHEIEPKVKHWLKGIEESQLLLIK